ncbi:MAG: hypothetical protein JOZ55_04615 [Alphaproteobacteria bacterium]|nr:hypothetical protein [Alphaproteobacteria bacterium]
MFWPPTPETETINGVEYRNVWLKEDAEAAAGARALGARVTPSGASLPPDFWAKNLCVVAFEADDVVALAPAEIRFSERVRANMAFLRVYVSPAHRQRGLVIPLAVKFHEIMRRYALDHPDKRIGGSMAIITAPGMLDEPVTKGFHVLMGFNRHNQPLIIRWFEHFRF